VITIAQKIKWLAPTDNTVIQVEISRSETLYGTYDVIATIDATTDGLLKSSSNQWVVEYLDSTGLRTYWYKVRFYNGSMYSAYSDPTTSEEILRLCTVDQVKLVLDTTGRWTNDEIFRIITEVDELIYLEFGTPMEAVISETYEINSQVPDRYYVGEENIYRVDRVFIGTATKTELYLDDGISFNNLLLELVPTISAPYTILKFHIGISPIPACVLVINDDTSSPT